MNNSGGAIYSYCSSTPSTSLIRSSVFQGNVADEGGAIYWCDTAGLTLEDCQFIGNIAGRGGAIRTGGQQGGIWKNLIFESNSSANEGGAIYFGSPPSEILDLSGMTFGGNYSGFLGGAVYITGDEPRIRFSDTLFCNNSPSDIHGQYIEGQDVLFRDECELGACCTNDICVMASGDDCDMFGGEWLGEDVPCTGSSCLSACLGDADGNGGVNIDDLLLVIARFGVTCP